MTGSFRNIIRIGDTSGPEPFEKKILSIGLRPDGFVFSVLDAENFKYLRLEDYEHSSDDYDDQFLVDLKQFLVDNNLYKAPFKQVHVSLFTPSLLLIPADICLENETENTFRFFAGLQEDHLIRSDKLNNLDAYGIYDFHKEIKNFLDESFDSYRLRHQGNALIESTLAATQLENWDADIVLHLKRSIFEVILLEKGKVSLYQSFEYRTLDDLLYYLFYVLEQFDKNAAYQRLLLIGEISVDCKSYQTLASLFHKVSFPERNDAFQYAGVFDQIPGQYYYNLLNLVTCG